MPTSTTRFRFEFRVHDWAERFATALCGSRCAFFVGFREDGTVRRVYCAQPDAAFDAGQKTQLAEAYNAWFLYAPFDDDSSAYIEWLNLPQQAIERWLGRRLDAQDFMDVRTTGTRDTWPDSWRVIVA